MRQVAEQGTGWRLDTAQGIRFVYGLEPEQTGYWLVHLPGHKVTLPAGERVTILDMNPVTGWFAAAIAGKDRVMKGWMYSASSKARALEKLK